MVPLAIAIGAGETSLAQIRDKINGAGAGVVASIRIDDALPPSTSPVMARLRAMGHVSRRSRAWRTATMMTSDRAVNGDMTGADGA